MKKILTLNPNTRVYWNGIYGDMERRAFYKAQGTDKPIKLAPGKVVSAQDTNRFKATVAEVKDGDKFLDMGCGVGILTTLVKEAHPNCEVWGTDISDVTIEINTKENPSIKYLHQYIGDQTELPDNYFDVVFCGETIEHLDDPADLFKDAHRVLKSDGKLIITTPRENHIASEEHVWEFTEEDVTSLYLTNGFKDVEFAKLPDTEHLFVIFGKGIKE